MARKSWELSRRSFLRGTGAAALGLPFLNAMIPSSAAAAGTSQAPWMVWFLAPVPNANGVWQKRWIPQKTGADFELPYSLEPIKDVKQHVTVLSQLTKKHSRKGDGHFGAEFQQFFHPLGPQHHGHAAAPLS